MQEGGHGGGAPHTGTRGLVALMTDLRECLPALIWRQLSAHTSCIRMTCIHVGHTHVFMCAWAVAFMHALICTHIHIYL